MNQINITTLWQQYWSIYSFMYCSIGVLCSKMLEIMMIKLRTELKYWSPKCVTSFMNINWIGRCWCWHTALHSCLPQKQSKKKSWQWGMNIFSQPSPTLATLKWWSLLWCARTKIKLPQKENSVRMKCDGSDVDKYSPAVPWDLWKNQHQTCKIVKNYRKTKSNKKSAKKCWWADLVAQYAWAAGES